MKPGIKITIQWRSKTQWRFLPQSDLNWTTFCTLLGNPREKEGPLSQAMSIVNALNRYFPEGTQLLEFRLGRLPQSKIKTRKSKIA